MRRHATAWVILVLALGGALTWYFNARQPVGPHPSAVQLPPPLVVEPPPAVEHPIEEAVAPEAPAEPEPLPPLADSDRYLAEVLGAMLGASAVTDWLVTEEIVHRIVATVDSLSSREIAPLVLPIRAPGGAFIVAGEEDAPGIAPENAARYQPYIDMLGRLEVDALVSLYVRLYPWFQQAYESLGYPDDYFNDRLVAVIDHLLETPRPDWPPLLIKPEAVYLYADPALEALSAGQKLLLRMGPDNGEIVRARLAELRAALVREPPATEPPG